MKQQKMTDYRPGYPRKVLRGAALTAAALVALGVTTGCRKAQPLELQTEGIVAVPEPTEEVLVLDGEVAIDEPTETPLMTTGLPLTATPATTPDPEELTTTGMVYVPEENGGH